MSHGSTKVPRTTEPGPGRSSLVAVTAAGILIAYFVDFGLAGGALWRIMPGLAAVPAIIIAVLLLPLSDTPRWYIMKGQREMVWVFYASESFPAQLRTLGASTMLTADLVANVIVAFFFLSALTSPGGVATFIFLLVFAVIAWLFVWWLAPETRGRPLEAIHAYWENGGKWSD